LVADPVSEIMRGFALRTGLEPAGGPVRRYLWTDAFAVCNYVGLFVEEADAEALGLALRLVDETHRVLGRHRPDDARSGWISGLDDDGGASHPTLGGLRIGKELPERRSGEPYDPAREWDRDGQYFHYLTKWMHALGCVSRVTEDPTYRRWAVELARSAHARFLLLDSAGLPIGLHWKMSVDLSRPLVPSSGQHDPLDAFITYSRLQGWDGAAAEYDLSREIDEVAQVCAGRNWFTDDPLGIGGLLTDAYAVTRMLADGTLKEADLLVTLLEDSAAGLATVVGSRLLEDSAERRLPFRELGLSIGLRAARLLRSRLEDESIAARKSQRLHSSLGALAEYAGLVSQIETFWLDPANQRSSSWTGHREINEVMLATSLAPYGYLET